ncbi:ABC transporter ATP-binding protein [Ammoniphilus resinae]|uniref:ABC-type polysaccharide/polyol phosphate transport system ATPase subunit n=1 Tax=Ammoniphilus resinae TaxID=861532 RepID=A0ABS4GWV2_9BACL|nr:ABC transporter ATP-binding protein [Ammoniphilus resinae]MBP1934763.1 ABC-type polysaccharide/polyol phosphate transport system ATPase subunit [Ammoniphilus resinae]
MNEENKIAVKVQNVTKLYKLYDKPIDRLMESINPFSKKHHKNFYALEDLSFTIAKGETLGIIGKNGSGKSTLLKMITGVLTPSSGSIEVNGKISALLELGAGFNPEYTGLENVYMNGTIMGFSREEMDKRIDEILSFADIGEFIHQPVKTYSSGMFVRLAFAVAINVDPDILIVDEALSVGDMRFQQKCLRKIEELKEKKTVLFVSHDLASITKFCNRVIWINEGKLVEDGLPTEVSKKYQAFMLDSNLFKYNLAQSEVNDQLVDNIDPIDPSLDVLGDNEAIIKGISLFEKNTNRKLTMVTPGQLVRLSIKVQFNRVLENPIVGFSIKDRLGNIVTQSNSYVLGQQINNIYEGKASIYSFEFTFPNLTNGNYTISPAIASGSQEDHQQHSWVHDALVIQVMDMQLYSLQGYLFLEDIQFLTS